VQAAFVIEVSRWNGSNFASGGAAVLAPDAAVASEVVIERTVFLDQDEPVEVPTEAPPQPEKASDAISAAAAMPLASRVLAGFPCGQSYKL